MHNHTKSKNINLIEVYAKYDAHFWNFIQKCMNNNNNNNNNVISGILTLVVFGKIDSAH